MREGRGSWPSGALSDDAVCCAGSSEHDDDDDDGMRIFGEI